MGIVEPLKGQLKHRRQGGSGEEGTLGSWSRWKSLFCGLGGLSGLSGWGASPPAQLVEQALGPDSKTSRPQWTPFPWVGSDGAHLAFRAAPQLTCIVSVADNRLARVAETAGVPSSLVGTSANPFGRRRMSGSIHRHFRRQAVKGKGKPQAAVDNRNRPERQMLPSPQAALK